MGIDGWWLVLSCLPASPCRPVDFRLRGNDGVVGLSCSPSPLIPLPSRERGTEVVLSCLPVPPCRPVDSRLRGNDGEGRWE